jgi:hypothetical protein
MSAKGKKEVELDEFYPTEPKAIEALLLSDQVVLPGGVWIEPCAGTGRIITTVNRLRKNIDWIICELNARFDAHLRLVARAGRDLLRPYGDFVHSPWPHPMADVLIMNPPFSLTMQFVEAAFKRARLVACLQRKNWFGSVGRSTWLQQHCPDDYTLPWRPSFRNDGKTDNCEYSWFVWPPEAIRGRRSGKVSMLLEPTGGQLGLFG